MESFDSSEPVLFAGGFDEEAAPVITSVLPVAGTTDLEVAFTFPDAVDYTRHCGFAPTGWDLAQRRNGQDWSPAAALSGVTGSARAIHAVGVLHEEGVEVSVSARYGECAGVRSAPYPVVPQAARLPLYLMESRESGEYFLWRLDPDPEGLFLAPVQLDGEFSWFGSGVQLRTGGMGVLAYTDRDGGLWVTQESVPTRDPDKARKVGAGWRQPLLTLGDVTGSGNDDLVTIVNGIVSVYPNRQYGQFGTRSTLPIELLGEVDGTHLFGRGDYTGTGAPSAFYVQDIGVGEPMFMYSGTRESPSSPVTFAPPVPVDPLFPVSALGVGYSVVGGYSVGDSDGDGLPDVVGIRIGDPAGRDLYFFAGTGNPDEPLKAGKKFMHVDADVYLAF